MAVNKEDGAWSVIASYKDWQGKRRRKHKRGFKTKGEAREWERDFLQTQQRNVDINFENFIKIYYEDMENRLKENTMYTKKYVIDLKILPYFKNKLLSEITTADVRAWQNMLLKQDYAPTYLKTINTQLSAIFNYAVRYFDLSYNPCRRAGAIGKSKSDEMLYWTQEEFNIFMESMKDKPQSRLAFLLLYWTGMRIGELLALTYEDINLEKKTIRINKSYQRIRGKDIITEPKTPKSNRIISLPDFLVDEINVYVSHLYGIMPYERMFRYVKSTMEHEIIRGIKETGVKRIRLHDLRHSHASFLVNAGIEPLQIANRLGHEKVETTLNTYSHLYPEHQTKIAEKLDKFYIPIPEET